MIHDRLLQNEHSSSWRKIKFLFMDDVKALSHDIYEALKLYDFECYEARSKHACLHQIVEKQPDIVLIDLDLIDEQVVAFIQSIREIKASILILTAICARDTHLMDTLDIDDYIIKPFSLNNLLARLRIAFKHAHVKDNEEVNVFNADNLQVDFVHRIVTVAGRRVSLTPTEYDLLHFLIIHLNKPVTYSQIWHAIRGEGDVFDAHTIRVHVSNLRQKLEIDPVKTRHILTELGIGYRFQTSPTFHTD